MEDWKIGTRISAGFAALILIAAALGLFGYAQVKNINRASTEISNNTLPSVYVVGPLKANTLAAGGLILEHALSSDKGEMNRLDSELADARSRGKALLARYETMFSNDKDREIYAKMQAARALFWVCGEEVLRISRLGTAEANKQALAMIQTRLKPLQASYVQAMDGLVDFNQANAAEASKAIIEVVSTASTGILAGIAIAILMAIGISFFVVRTITLPLATAVGLVERVAQGDLTHSVAVTSTDELGQMLKALNGMVENLKTTAAVGERISEGDLTVRAKALSEKDALGNALVRMMESLRSTVRDVTSAATNVATGSRGNHGGDGGDGGQYSAKRGQRAADR